MFKRVIEFILERYVRQYFAAHTSVKLIVVAGSVGKTSTKVAIATVLSTKYRVRLHEGNHNTHLSAPLAMLGIEYPESLRNPLIWLSIFAAARARVRQPADVDVVIQELGVDRRGDMARFASYLNADIGVVTSVAPEHMEYLGSMETVAEEELGVASFSRLVLINRDDVPGQYASLLTNPQISTYGTSGAAEYRFEDKNFSLEAGHTGTLIGPEYSDAPLALTVHVVGEHNLRPVMAAAAVGIRMGLRREELQDGIDAIRPVKGRMNILRGLEHTTILDDTYNASPSATAAALQTLYQLQAPQRIALLGSMNELGASSAAEHEAIGKLCDPSLVSWVVTIGEAAERYLAPAARANGCQVKSFASALQAGAFVHGILEPGAIILAKGSEGGIYAEEAVKMLLHSTEEENQLVRQSPSWMKVKQKFFLPFSS